MPSVATPPKSEIVSNIHKTIPAVIAGFRDGRRIR